MILSALYSHDKANLTTNYNRRITASNLPQEDKTRLINAGFTEDAFKTAKEQFDIMNKVLNGDAESASRFKPNILKDFLTIIKGPEMCPENVMNFFKLVPSYLQSVGRIVQSIQVGQPVQKKDLDVMGPVVRDIQKIALPNNAVYLPENPTNFQKVTACVFDNIDSIKNFLESLSNDFSIATIEETEGFPITKKINRVVFEILRSEDYNNLLQVLATSGTFSNQFNKMSLQQLKALPTSNWIQQSLSNMRGCNDYEGLLKAILLDDARQAFNEVLKALQKSLNPSRGHLSEMKMGIETDVRPGSPGQGNMDVEKKHR